MLPVLRGWAGARRVSAAMGRTKGLDLLLLHPPNGVGVGGGGSSPDTPLCTMAVYDRVYA